MALTPSTMVELGNPAPAFNLPDTEGVMVSLEDFAGKKALLVMFICNHCPYVKHLKKELSSLSAELIGREVGVVAINSNDVENYPEDSPEKMKRDKQAFGYPFPYLFDESQSVAKAYDAACTPDFFLYDQKGKLAYRGQFDDSRPGNGIPVTGKDLLQAVDCVLAGKAVQTDQKPSVGCNIKWK